MGKSSNATKGQTLTCIPILREELRVAPRLAGDEMSPCASGNAEHSARWHEDEELGKAGSLPYRSFWSWE